MRQVFKVLALFVIAVIFGCSGDSSDNSGGGCKNNKDCKSGYICNSFHECVHESYDVDVGASSNNFDVGVYYEDTISLPLDVTPSCSSHCNKNGQKVCDGNAWKKCGDYDGDGCLEWSEMNNCLNTEYCGDGICHPQEVLDTQSYPDTYVSPDTTCADECDYVGGMCVGNGYEDCHDFNGDGCIDYKYVPCDSGEKCVNVPNWAICVSDCTDECLGEEEDEVCTPWNEYVTCKDIDEDGCLEMDISLPCPSGTICTLGEGCVTSCTDDCKTNENGVCSSFGTFYTECKINFDADSCLDVKVTECLAGTTCTPGKGCVASCTDDPLCSYEGEKFCLNDQPWECVVNSKGCLYSGWTSIDKCSDIGKTCQEGECVELGDYCDACNSSADCKPGWECTMWPSFASWCYPNIPCSKNSDCGSDLYHCKVNTYTDGTKTFQCAPQEHPICYGNEVWSEDFCGNLAGILDSCDIYGMVCENGECVASCVDKCTPLGKKECSGKGWKQCSKFDTSACLEWSTITSCKANETCSNGVCAASCEDDPFCTSAGQKCMADNIGSFIVKCGYLDSDPCLELEFAVECLEDEVCQGNECVKSCTNECDYDWQKKCLSDTVEIWCGQYDSDPCWDLGSTSACFNYETCIDGQGCCTSECSFDGQKVCLSDTVYGECWEPDPGDCLIVSSYNSCKSGYKCQNGECVFGCVKKTCSDYSGKCGSLSDGCSGTINCSCSSSQTCYQGSCCTPKICSQLGKECGSWDDGCGGKVNCPSCSSGKTCSVDGKCVCQFNCTGKTCGDDGCGGSCGNCTGSTPVCFSDKCVECTPNTIKIIDCSVDCVPKQTEQICDANGYWKPLGPCEQAPNLQIVDFDTCANNDSCCISKTVPALYVGHCINSGTSVVNQYGCSTGVWDVDSTSADQSGKFCLPAVTTLWGCTVKTAVVCCSGEKCLGFDVIVSDDCYCTPNCSGKQCGSDGCNGTCGTCPSGKTCQNNQCVCTPNCTGKTCGDDGCGGSCGSCSSNYKCENYKCVYDAKCGNGVCDSGENPCNCKTDCSGCCTTSDCSSCGTCKEKTCVNYVCGCKATTPCCGNSSCESGESYCNCSSDCSKICGDGCCSSGEDKCGCEADCGKHCGDSSCNCGETCSTCSQDCGSCATCGDGICNGSDTQSNCCKDCGCPSGKTCQNNQCICAPSCSGKTCGDDGCDGSCGTCNNPPADTCLDSYILRDYTGSGSCSGGQCNYSYNDSTCQYGCENGKCKGCTPKTCPQLSKECGSWDDGCGGKVPCPSCPSGKSCDSNGKCISICTDDCTPSGKKECSGNGWKQCGNYDADTCLEWSSVTPCNASETCSGGSCVTTCTDECTPSGKKECSGNSWKICTDYDTDSCLEWSNLFSCKATEICSGGNCVPNCTDDCSPSGKKECVGNSWKQCGNYDADTCLEWSSLTLCNDNNDCTINDTCQNGTCKGTPIVPNAKMDQYEGTFTNDKSQNATALDSTTDCMNGAGITANIYPKSNNDIDWYWIYVDDAEGCTLYPEFNLYNIPSSDDYNLCVYYKPNTDCAPGKVECLSGVWTQDYIDYYSTPGELGKILLEGCCSKNAGSSDEYVKLDPEALDCWWDDDGGYFVKIYPQKSSYCGESYSLDYEF